MIFSWSAAERPPDGMPHIYLVAGEASGDALGARLIDALTSEVGGELRLDGVGGGRMETAGLRPLFPSDDLAVMGIAEVLPGLPRILQRLGRVERSIRLARPDAVVTIDAPGFNFRLGRRLHDTGIPLIHYVAPTVWAWKPGRARRIARFLDRLLALFPFEPPYFERVGLPTTFVGHPIVETPPSGIEPGFRAAQGVDTDAPILLILPGSRTGEVSRLGPLFAQTAKLLLARLDRLRIVVAAASGRSEQIAGAFRDLPVIVAVDDADKKAWYAAADVALAASGSVTLELAHEQTAMVVAYRMAPMTWEIVRRMVSIDSATVINLMHGSNVIPEFLQNNCRPEQLASAVEHLFRCREARERQVEATSALIRTLRSGDQPPSRQAARAILATLGTLTVQSRRLYP